MRQLQDRLMLRLDRMGRRCQQAVLERVGDLCTNIAEDGVFLCTGDIVRHAKACEEPGE